MPPKDPEAVNNGTYIYGRIKLKIKHRKDYSPDRTLLEPTHGIQPGGTVL